MYFFPSLLSPNDTVTMLLPFSLPLIVCSIPPLWIPALPLFQPCDAEDHSLYFFEMPINLSTTSPPSFFNNKKRGIERWDVPLYWASTPSTVLKCQRLILLQVWFHQSLKRVFTAWGKCIVRNWLLKYVFNSIDFKCKSKCAYPYHGGFDANNIFHIWKFKFW